MIGGLGCVSCTGKYDNISFNLRTPFYCLFYILFFFLHENNYFLCQFIRPSQYGSTQNSMPMHSLSHLSFTGEHFRVFISSFFFNNDSGYFFFFFSLKG